MKIKDVVIVNRKVNVTLPNEHVKKSPPIKFNLSFYFKFTIVTRDKASEMRRRLGLHTKLNSCIERLRNWCRWNIKIDFLRTAKNFLASGIVTLIILRKYIWEYARSFVST